jgi:hypothetical protein
MKSDPHEDWLDHVSGPRPDPEVVRRLHSHGVLSPAERRRLGEELALNGLLSAHRPVRAVSSNFTALVMEQVSREGDMARRGWQGWNVRAWLRPFAAVVAGGVACWMGLVLLGGRAALPRLGDQALALDHAASLPGIDAAVLADFDAVLKLGTSPRPDDEELILALAR